MIAIQGLCIRKLCVCVCVCEGDGDERVMNISFTMRGMNDYHLNSKNTGL